MNVPYLIQKRNQPSRLGGVVSGDRVVPLLARSAFSVELACVGNRNHFASSLGPADVALHSVVGRYRFLANATSLAERDVLGQVDCDGSTGSGAGVDCDRVGRSHHGRGLALALYTALSNWNGGDFVFSSLHHGHQLGRNSVWGTGIYIRDLNPNADLWRERFFNASAEQVGAAQLCRNDFLPDRTGDASLDGHRVGVLVAGR